MAKSGKMELGVFAWPCLGTSGFWVVPAFAGRANLGSRGCEVEFFCLVGESPYKAARKTTYTGIAKTLRAAYFDY